MNSAIGGYFELEFPKAKPFLYPAAYEFQSARAAFLALLRTGKPSRVYMPHYICDSMVAPLENAGVECLFYSIDGEFNIIGDVELGEADWLFYVNYFGVCEKNIDGLFHHYNPRQLILDHSQAFYSPPRDCLATIYSARKFFGVPDGGLLLTGLPIAEPQESDQESLSRAISGLTRLAKTPEAGYADYQKAEHSLEQCEPLKMSQLTRRILHGIDFEAAKTRRNENFDFLHRHLGSLNQIELDLQNMDGPLCYPFLVDSVELRSHLIRERVFVATYWPETIARVSNNSHESKFVKSLLPLPCDQRYGVDAMLRVAEICLDFLSRKKLL
jgi:hypothetical protein